MVNGPLDEWKNANQLITRTEAYATRLSQLSDEYWELQRAKKEAQRIHKKNVEQIQRDSKLWEIAGCCVRWDGSKLNIMFDGDGVESDPRKGRDTPPSPRNIGPIE